MRTSMSNVFALSSLILLASSQAGTCHTCFMTPLPSHHPVLILNKSAQFIKSHAGFPVGLGHNHLIQNPLLEERNLTQGQLVNSFRQRFIDRDIAFGKAYCPGMKPPALVGITGHQKHHNQHQIKTVVE
jgi:hypothetical protein